MKVEILPHPKEIGFIVVFPSQKNEQKLRNEQKIEKVFSEVMADLIYKNYLPKPARVFCCDRTGDYYFPIEVRRPRPSLLEDLKFSLNRVLEE